MELVFNCKRTRLGSGVISSSTVKRMLSDHERSGFAYHVITRKGGDCWLVSGDREGLPVVEAAIPNKCPGPIVVLSSSSDGQISIAIVKGPNNQEIIEKSVASIATPFVQKAIEATALKGGTIITVDTVLDVLPQTDTPISPVIVGHEQLQNHCELTRKAKYSVPMSNLQKVVIGIICLLTVIVAIAIGVVSQRENEITETVDIYKSFRAELTERGSPKAMTWQLSKDLLFIQHIDGWKVSNIDLTKEQVLLHLTREEGGRVDSLMQLAQRTGREVVSVNSDKATIASFHTAVPSLTEAVTVPIEGMQTFLTLAVDDWLPAPETKLTWHSIQTKKGYDVLPLEWSINNYTVEDFDVLGTLLNSLPVVAERASLTIADSGYVSGKVSMTMFGCRSSRIKQNKCI